MAQHPISTRARRDRGYPNIHTAQENAHRGYIRKAEQLAHESEDIVWSRKQGASAVAYETASGKKVYRLYDTNIVEIHGRTVKLNTGGWSTPTTRSHMMKAVKLFTGRSIYIYGDKGDTLIHFYDEKDRRQTYRFELTQTFSFPGPTQ